MEKIFESRSSKQTYDIGYRLGKTLKRGDVVAVYGDLGAGKTVITKGLAKGIGVEEEITSPTYIFVNEYNHPIDLYHFDMYRICDEEEAVETGVSDLISDESICIIEWPERIEGILPDKRINIHIEKDIEKGPDYRKIFIYTEKK